MRCRQITQNNNVRQHEGSFREYSHLRSEVVAEVEPTLISLWKYDAETNRPYQKHLMGEQKKAYREYFPE